ncbi:RNA polymerase sigma factor [Clostridium sp. ZS2-4]|uniref:RNA polymerase sigma factor n=1 Tax=Clostridium sp. ZS2-4 TaxID=2987703 RepID=UPI00227A5CCE|nr:sigma-70 family RNA polymerase sigma factor [Clostridium sp. ZS2-4]MCY6355932.1 sigma-70 family RNA polymerase sigma factor [Clostridium sp. ZS2-4]
MENERLEELLMRQIKIVYKYLIKIGVQVEDAEDIIQDTLCKAISYIDAIDEEKISSWLFKVALNKYYNLYKKKKRKKQIYLDDEVIANLVVDNSAEFYIISSELKDTVQKVLNSLKESYKNLLIFKYVINLSYKEIGNILDMKEDKVKVYLYRARNKFKELWEDCGDVK